MSLQNDNTRQLLYLAALLHDIGKFYQRADDGITNSTSYKDSELLTADTKKLVNLLCPSSTTGQPGYVHVLWTYQFIKNLQLSINKEQLASLSASHHNPDTKKFEKQEEIEGLASFIQLADSLASWMDRTSRIPSEKEEYTIKTQPLYSLFSHILLHNLLREFENSDHIDIKQIYVDLRDFYSHFGYTPKFISLDKDTLFPHEVGSINVSQHYKELKNHFDEELKKLPSGNLQSYIDSLFYLLKKYLWAVPSSTSKYDMPDISLFEHLKVTAAFTICLYDYYQEHPYEFNFNPSQRFSLSTKENVYPFLLFCGDLSGIQQYIYNIYSKEARKSLKGRSFYLEILTQILIRYILTELNLFPAHEVYASGGKFYLLLPNTSSVIEKIQKIEKELQDKIINEKSGDIYVCIDYINFGYNRDASGSIQLISQEKDCQDIGSLWKTLTDRVGLKKASKYKQVLVDRFEDFFIPYPKNYPEKVEICAVTGEIDDPKHMEKIDEENDVYVLDKVYQQTQLGDALKTAKYLVIGLKSPHLPDPIIEPLSLGWGVWLLSDSEMLGKISSLKDFSISSINDTHFLRLSNSNHQCTYKFLFYGGNEGNDKTFSDLLSANGENEESNFKRLGVLRMDVDNLGNIFKHGLDFKIPNDDDTIKVLDSNQPSHLPIINRKKSFSAYATLSSQFNYFFTGYLNVLRNQVEFADYVQIVYSGGDDVFVVGRWDKVIEFARCIQQDFSEYTLSKQFLERIKSTVHTKNSAIYNYPGIGISGGIELVTEKYPIQRAADKAGEAEDAAKQFNYNGILKNAITLLGVPVSWHEEFQRVVYWKEKLLNALLNGVISKGLLQKIFDYYEQIKLNIEIENEKINRKINYSWQWNMVYAFTRNKTDENKDLLQEIQNHFICRPRERVLIALAARWAELAYRVVRTS